MESRAYLLFPLQLLQNLDLIWSFFLVVTRFAAMMIMVPGLGMGQRGMLVRMPAVLIMSYASTLRGAGAELPPDWIAACAAFVSEIMLGTLLGLLPTMVIAGLQAAAQLASTSMGLGAAHMFDPAMNASVSALGALLGDLFICIFLVTGGHHSVIYAVSGLGGSIIPGTFLINEQNLAMLINRVGAIFDAGVMISAPVVVAILLTNFVMGLISRAVPQVNIFIINFPLTIGIGLVLSMLALPEIGGFLERDFTRMEEEIMVLVNGTKRVGSDHEAAPASFGSLE